MRLVDADAFKAEGRELYREAGWDLREVHYSQLDTECNIDMMPTIEAEPIKHGRWIVRPVADWGASNTRCSVCGYEDFQPMVLKGIVHKYCPNCGARMDEQQEVE